MEVFLYKACKAFFLALVVKEVKAERVEHCIGAQSSCFSSQVQMSPTCIPAKMHQQLLMCMNIP